MILVHTSIDPVFSSGEVDSNSDEAQLTPALDELVRLDHEFLVTRCTRTKVTFKSYMIKLREITISNNMIR